MLHFLSLRQSFIENIISIVFYVRKQKKQKKHKGAGTACADAEYLLIHEKIFFQSSCQYTK